MQSSLSLYGTMCSMFVSKQEARKGMQVSCVGEETVSALRRRPRISVWHCIIMVVGVDDILMTVISSLDRIPSCRNLCERKIICLL